MKEILFKKPVGLAVLAGLIVLNAFVDTDLRAVNFLIGFFVGLSAVIATVNIFELTKAHINPIKDWYRKDIFEARIK